MSSIESCAVAGAGFLEDFSNWRQPIVGSVINCPDVDFVPAYFSSSAPKYVCADE